MEKIEFPWLKNEVAPTKEPEVIELKRSRQIFELCKPYLPYLILLLGLFVISNFRSTSKTTKTARPAQTVSIVMTMIELPKGQVIPSEALEIVQVKADMLTKAQQLRALNPSQLEKLTHRIVAKKDIAPQSPIFWNDLALVQDSHPTTKTNKMPIEIFFPKQN